MKHNGHLTIQYVTDYWGTRSNAKLFYGMPGAILYFNVDSIVITVLLKKVNKQVGTFRLYLGCFGWVLNPPGFLIYSMPLRHNITYAQNLGLSNHYAFFMCSDVMRALNFVM